MKKFSKVFLAFIFVFWAACRPQLKPEGEPIQLIVRGDDMGMTQACNQAVERCFREGILTCASLLVPSPWFEQAARMCREHAEWCIGVHLAVNGEWQDYKWRPVLPSTQVPTLVDEDGYFYPTTEAFLAANPNPEEVDRELRAQVNLALKRKIDVQYIDTHMDSLLATPELHQVVLNISRDYRLPISQESGEQVLDIYNVSPSEKEKALGGKLKELKAGFWLLFVHPGLDTPEERALKDSNPQGLPNVAAHRTAEAKAVVSKKIRKIIRQRGIKLTDYRPLRDKMRSEKMPQSSMGQSGRFEKTQAYNAWREMQKGDCPLY